MSMPKPSASTTIIGLLSITLAGVISLLLFISFNSGISLDNARQAQHSYREEARTLRPLLLDVAPADQEEALRVIQSKYADSHVIKHDAHSISVDSILLKYQNKRLDQVCSTQDDLPDSCASHPEQRIQGYP